MSLRSYSARQMRRRPGRTLLTLLGISLGVASIVAISLTTHTTKVAYRDMYHTLSGHAAFEVVAEGQGGFDPAVLSVLSSIPGVKAAVPLIQKPAALWGPNGVMGVVALGVDPQVDSVAREYTLRSGTLLGSDEAVLLEAGFAAANRYELGKKARMMTTSGAVSLPVAGLLEPRGVAAVPGGGIVVLPLAAAQRLFSLENQINTVQIVVQNESNLRLLRDKIAAVLPSDLIVQDPAMRGALSHESLRATEQGFSALSVVSLVAGAFVILNTFQMSLGERRRQLAVLRSVGATSNQLMSMLLREALLLGVAGTILGMAFGVAMAVVMTRAMGPLLGLALTLPKFVIEPFVLAGIVGPGMTLIATLFPARRAAKNPPLDELLGVSGMRGEEIRYWPAYLGVVMIILNLGVLYGFFHGYWPDDLFVYFIPPAMTIYLVGVVLAIPLIYQPMERLVSRVARPIIGVEGKLALRQLDRRPGRAALTVGVLSIAVIITIGMGNSLLNNIRDVEEWHSRAITADYYVRAIMPNAGTLASVAIPAALEVPLEKLPGVRSVEKISFIPSRVGNEQMLILARDFERGQTMPLDLETGAVDDAWSRLAEGEVVIGTVLARRAGLVAGGEIELPTRNGRKRFRIAGTTTDYTVGGMVAYMDWTAARDIMKLSGVDAYLVRANPDDRATAAASIEKFCDDNSLQLQTNADLRKMIDELVTGVVGFLWLLMAMVFVVASLGIVNTLTMTVIEQTREIAVLRAVAMTRGQIRKMVMSQALAIGGIALIPGSLAGVGLAYLMNLTNSMVVGNPVPFHLNHGFNILCCSAALITSLLAALPPAARAVRLSVAGALQYE